MPLFARGDRPRAGELQPRTELFLRRVAAAVIGRLEATYAPDRLATEPRSKSRASSVRFRARAFTRLRRPAKVGPNRDGRSASAFTVAEADME